MRSARRSPYTAKTRRYRRTTTRPRRRMMPKRKLLDVTSTKKRDTLGYYDPAATTSRGLTFTGGPIGEIKSFIFSPTARNSTSTTETTDRNASTVFWKGVSETVSITANSQVPWRWRRIVFETKGLRVADSFLETSSGYTRVCSAFSDAATMSRLFKGTRDVDWFSAMDAQIYNNRARVIYDKLRVMRSAAGPHFHTYKDYIKLEKNMHYDEDENGGTITTSPWSTDGRSGMGDIYIFDLFECMTGGTSHANTQ